MPGTGLCKSSPMGSARSSGVVVEFACVGNELARDRIVRIGAVDQRGEVRRDRDSVARCDRLQLSVTAGCEQAGGAQVGNGA